MKDFIELLKNKKYRTLIKLILWIMFMIVVCCMAVASNKRNVNTDDDVNKVVLKFDYDRIKVNYVLDDFTITGVVEDDVFEGRIVHKNGFSYQIKYENGNLTKVGDSVVDEFVLIQFDNDYLIPNYLINLFNENDADVIEENKVFNYNIDGRIYKLTVVNEYHYIINLSDGDVQIELNYEMVSQQVIW